MACRKPELIGILKLSFFRVQNAGKSLRPPVQMAGQIAKVDGCRTKNTASAILYILMTKNVCDIVLTSCPPWSVRE